MVRIFAALIAFFIALPADLPAMAKSGWAVVEYRVA